MAIRRLRMVPGAETEVWGRVLATATGVAALAGTAQLGFAYGLDLLRFARTFDAATQWSAQLAWVTWLAVVAVLAGAAGGARAARRYGRGLDLGTRVAVAAAAGVGAAIVVPLTALPARAAQLTGDGPALTTGLTATFGAVIGVFAAVAALSLRPVGASMSLVAAVVWLLALASLAPSLGPDAALPEVRLGVPDLPAFSEGTRNTLAVLTAPVLALAIGAVIAMAAQRRRLPWTEGVLPGAAGPGLLAVAYVVAGSGGGDSAAQAAAYWGSLTAVAAGLLAAVLVALVVHLRAIRSTPAPLAGTGFEAGGTGTGESGAGETGAGLIAPPPTPPTLPRAARPLPPPSAPPEGLSPGTPPGGPWPPPPDPPWSDLPKPRTSPENAPDDLWPTGSGMADPTRSTPTPSAVADPTPPVGWADPISPAPPPIPTSPPPSPAGTVFQEHAERRFSDRPGFSGLPEYPGLADLPEPPGALEVPVASEVPELSARRARTPSPETPSPDEAPSHEMWSADDAGHEDPAEPHRPAEEAPAERQAGRKRRLPTFKLRRSTDPAERPRKEATEPARDRPKETRERAQAAVTVPADDEEYVDWVTGLGGDRTEESAEPVRRRLRRTYGE